MFHCAAAWLLCIAGVVSPAMGQSKEAPQPPAPTHPAVEVDPFALPPEMEAFFSRVSTPGTLPNRLQAILTAIFSPPEQGGLGMQYDNGRTRTVTEVWRDRKANCLSLTAFFVGAARVGGMRATYAEALNTMRWTRVKGMIRKERHVVALGEHRMGGEDLVADFLPALRRRVGFYMVRPLTPNTFRAMFYANRAVEFLEDHELEGAMAQVDHALKIDPESTAAWNIRGVILHRQQSFVDAEAAFRKAIALDPSDTAAYGNLEVLLKNLGRAPEAIRVRERSLQVRKRDPYFQFFLAEEALAEKNVDEAIRRIKLAIRIHPRESEFHLLKARIYLEKGDIGEVKEALEEAQKWASPEEKLRYENKMEALKRQEAEKGRPR